MIDKTYAEFQEMSILNGGDVRIGCAESYLISHLASTIKKLRVHYPLLHYHIKSGDSEVVIERLDQLNFSGFTNLFYNGTVFVKSGLGLLLTFEHLSENGPELCFRPLTPSLENKMYIIWKKYQVFTPITEVLINALKEQFINESQK